MAASKKNYMLVVTVGSQKDNAIYEDLFFGPFTEDECRRAERLVGDRFNGADLMSIGRQRLLSKTLLRDMTLTEVPFPHRYE